MQDVVSSPEFTLPPNATDAEYEALFEQMLAEMRRLNARMDGDRADIERLKAETQVIKASIDARLAQIQALLDAPRRRAA